MAFCNEMLGSILDSGQRRWRTRRSRTSAWLTCPLPKAEGFFSGGWILVSQRLLEYNAWASNRILFLDFLVLLSIFFLAKIFLPLPWISDSRRLSRRIHNASASWKKGPKSPVNSSSLVLLCPPSSLYDLSPPSNGLVYMSIFLPSWHFSHFPKIEFRWPFSLFSPCFFFVGYAHTKVQCATQYITPRE